MAVCNIMVVDPDNHDVFWNCNLEARRASLPMDPYYSEFLQKAALNGAQQRQQHRVTVQSTFLPVLRAIALWRDVGEDLRLFVFVQAPDGEDSVIPGATVQFVTMLSSTLTALCGGQPPSRARLTGDKVDVFAMRAMDCLLPTGLPLRLPMPDVA